LEQQPDNADLLLKRGNLQRRHGDWASARADFRRVREIQPDNKNIDWFEGRLDVESGRAAEGVQYLDRYLLANPDNAIALQNRAQG
jgi:predicted Zn-dependent protease